MPTLAAMAYKTSIGQPIIYPRNDLNYSENFLHMMFAGGWVGAPARAGWLMFAGEGGGDAACAGCLRVGGRVLAGAHKR